MTEQVWLAATNPKPLLEFLRSKNTDRKFRLLGVAFCRRWDMYTDPRLLGAMGTTEKYVDGRASESERIGAETLAMAVYDEELDSNVDFEFAVGCEPVLALVAKLPYTADSASTCAWDMVRAACFVENDFSEDLHPELQHEQVVLVHDVFGNPFRPVELNPDWLTSTVLALARQVYESRDFSAMPILADALQDAGCESLEVLSHCRCEGRHVRGCWVVDAVLGMA